MSGSWWDEEVRFLQSPSERKPYQVAPILRTVGVCAAAAAGGFIAGVILYKIAHSKMGHYIGRSVVRGFVYSAIFNLTGLRINGRGR